VTEGLGEGIDELYGLPLDRFTTERDALVKELRAAGDTEGAAKVKALRKPVVPAWALNLLAREKTAGVRELVELGDRLRAAQRRAMSGGDVEPFRAATEERRALVSRLARDAERILERAGSATAAHADAVVATLEAAAADGEAAELLISGRLTRPLRPPTTFGGEPGLRVLEGGKRGAEEAPRVDPAAAEARRLERELRAAEARERRMAEAVERERARVDDLERRRTEARERLRSAEAELRGVSLEVRRLRARITKAGDRRRR
jgi:hypothetical protein